MQVKSVFCKGIDMMGRCNLSSRRRAGLKPAATWEMGDVFGERETWT